MSDIVAKLKGQLCPHRKSTGINEGIAQEWDEWDKAELVSVKLYQALSLFLTRTGAQFPSLLIT